MAQTEAAFKIEGLSKSYNMAGHNIPVLQEINLEVKHGEWVTLVGASGSGKTTLLHLLGTLDKPSDGRISCFGRNFASLMPWQKNAMRRHTIGFVFQNYHLFAELNALENALLPARQWLINRRAMYKRARQLLEQFGLGDRLKHRPPELSGGEQQRVALARALINDPEIILADEPTGNLDDEAARHIMNILRNLCKKHSKTIVMVTHDRELAGKTDRVLELKSGLTEPLPNG
ncbi:MAG: ABC transporter ATP-binding protein [Lentisphaeria bacterium]